MWRSLFFRAVAERSSMGNRCVGAEQRPRCSFIRGFSSPVSGSPSVTRLPPIPSSSGPDPKGSSRAEGSEVDGHLSFSEAKKLLRLVNVEALKRKLGVDGQEVIGYSQLVETCLEMGVVRSGEEAEAFTKVLDDAGVVLLFRNKVYLHPDKVVELMKKAVPLALAPEDDPRREELQGLLKRKEEIDQLAHRQVRHVLWSGLGFFVLQVGLFFRLTFWEFSWDVMEPITFFTTTTGLLIGYAYFLFTSRDPTYQDLMKRLFLARQRKLFVKHQFDVNRFTELQKQCKFPLEESRAVWKSPVSPQDHLRSSY